MNIAGNVVKTLQCVQCPHVYIMVGNVPIGLAMPRRVDKEISGQDKTGVCPNHPRKGVAQNG